MGDQDGSTSLEAGVAAEGRVARQPDIARSTATGCGDSVGAAAEHSLGCELKLVCCDGTLFANSCVLRRASSVLRETLCLKLPQPGELQLPNDSAAAWQVVLNLLSLEAYPLQLVNMDNVAALLVLADKYDIPIVRGTCAHFLHLNAASLRITGLLSSPANILTAATWVIKYLSMHVPLKTYCTTVLDRLDVELRPLMQRPPTDEAGNGAHGGVSRDMATVIRWQLDIVQLVSQLEDVVKTQEYLEGVAAEVQFKVSGAMLTALRNLAGRLPPFCQRCGGPLVSGHDAFHSDCAATHYTSQHTKGCRLCGVAMPPSHARFCNSCAYRRHK